MARSEPINSIAAKIGEINKQIESVDQINAAVDAKKAWKNLHNDIIEKAKEVDGESYSAFVEMFNRFGYQAWIERVSDSPEGAMIYIEDGTAEYDYAGVAAGSEDGVEGNTSPPAPSEDVTSDRN